MDGIMADHSDSDSGESWTLLEHTSVNGGVSDTPDNQSSNQRKLTSNTEKDEDTDGISIISDSDHETSTPCELSYDCDKCLEENQLAEPETHQYISVSPLEPNINNPNESIRRDDDLLGDNSGKHKTYVHRRNKRLSTVLNIIMLGSVITAAGVAIGHMWGAKNDCTLHTTPTVNKILSNLYKLQEENAYLRNKLKELTLASIQVYNRPVSEKLTIKQQRCKKVYEESINNKNTDKATKCLDNNVEHILNIPMTQPEYEKDFLHDIDKLKHVYQQNKSWLDEEVAKRIKREVKSSKLLKDILKSTNLNTVDEEIMESKDESIKSLLDPTTKMSSENIEDKLNLLNPSSDNSVTNKRKNSKISYADSLKTENQTKETPNKKIKLNYKDIKQRNKDTYTKNNRKGEISDTMPEIVWSEHEFEKDDRYMAPRTKQGIKKRNKQKSHKNKKRKNKYEQWEMKGGYQKEYDDFSITSSQENDYTLKHTNSIDRINNHMNQHNNKNVKKLHVEDLKNTSKHKNYKKGINEEKDSDQNNVLNWYDKRTAFRSEARKKLEKELFAESTPNKARWYFRRMKKREQCRAKGNNNSTNRKLNYKMKH